MLKTKETRKEKKARLEAERREVLGHARLIERMALEDFPRDALGLRELAEDCGWIAAAYTRGSVTTPEDQQEVIRALARFREHATKYLLQILYNGGEIPKI